MTNSPSCPRKPLAIAITGVGGIFPGSEALDQFWKMIEEGRSASEKVPDHRWPEDADKYVNKRLGKPDAVLSSRNCSIKDMPANFERLNLPKGLINKLDPLFHLTLQAGRDAFFSCKHENLDLNRVSVILANIVLPTDSLSLLTRQLNLKAIEAELGNQTLSQNSGLFDIEPLNRLSAELPAGLLAAALGLGGGCYTLDAACASSLYAIKLACDELESGRVDAVLTGGVSRPSSHFTQMGFSQLQALSSSGICRPFDKDADGLVVGEGAGIFVLKRLDDAIASQDKIYAVIRGIGLANDVGGSLLAPDSEGQLRAMKAAYSQAGWNPEDIELIECHGTGTPKGDAVELDSLKQLWEGRTSKNSCVIGSVKSNVGHLLTAAGAAGLMKLLMALKNQKLPPTANFKSFDPMLNMEKTPFRVLSKAEPWQQKNPGTTRKFALSAFGFGGIDGHILLEEFIPDKTRSFASEKKSKDDVVIVSIAARAGSCQSLYELQKSMFDGKAMLSYIPETRHLVSLKDKWLKKGSYIDKIQIELGKFRISPKEIPEILPQQLLMLNTVDQAIASMKGTAPDRKRWGVSIGINQDFESTNFASRWALKHDLDNNFSSLEYSEALKDAITPPLNNTRTVGALGGMVASRIAREFHCGGPSHTFSAAENSGLAALNAAVNGLQNRETDLAIVGSVDLAGDLRSLLTVDQLRSYSRKNSCLPFDTDSDGPFPGEGAVALVLKRKQDAIKDNDRIIAAIKGIGKASRSDFTINSATDACIRAINEAWQNADLTMARADLIEASGSADPDEDFIEAEALSRVFPSRESDLFNQDEQLCALVSCKTVIGHTGCASGLFSLARAALAIYQEIIPAMPGLTRPIPSLAEKKDFFFTPNQTQYWYRNRIKGPRTAAVNSIGLDGSFFHIVLQGLEDKTKNSIETEQIHAQERLWACGEPEEQPFVVEGENICELREKLSAFANFESDSIRQLATDYYFQNRRRPEAKLCVSIVASSVEELKTRAQTALNHINNSPDEPLKTLAEANDRLFYNSDPQGAKGKTVFVFPGSGNHFLGMGAELGVYFTKYLRELDKKHELLAAQFAPERVIPRRLAWEQNWQEKAMKELLGDHNSLVFSHVSICALISDIVRGFYIEPQIIMGYSLGETAGNFATGTWRERDEMVRRMRASNLFKTELIGDYNAPRKYWNLKNNDKIDWLPGVIQCPAKEIKKIIKNFPMTYILIENTPEESVIGGNKTQVEALIKEISRPFFPLAGVSSVHCEAALPASEEYRALHLYDCFPPEGVQFISSAKAELFIPEKNKSADSILAQCIGPINFPACVETAWNAGARNFLEIGPRNSMSRMIAAILKDRPHFVRATMLPGQSEVSSLVRFLASCAAERIKVNMEPWFAKSALKVQKRIVSKPEITVQNGSRPDFSAFKKNDKIKRQQPVENKKPEQDSNFSILQGWVNSQKAIAKAHDAFLKFTSKMADCQSSLLQKQIELAGQLNPLEPDQIPGVEPAKKTVCAENRQPAQIAALQPVWRFSRSRKMPEPSIQPVVLDQKASMEFATGKISKVLGDFFAEIDKHPTRVRLPDIPLNFVDRILLIEGEKGSLGKGRVITEHDVYPDTWYLDNDCMPTGLAVEAGQADLFLSSWLGIDFKTKGLAKYRLLDAVVTFHGHLPGPGDTIRYDIRVDRFIRQADTYLFFFEFDGSIGGQRLITMRNGCAGFFTDQQLADGKGIVLTHEDTAIDARPDLIGREFLPEMKTEAFGEAALNALRKGDVAKAFGNEFENINIRPQPLPDGRMKMIDRITEIQPHGGRFGLGQIKAEISISENAWFLTQHFCDDPVMPGTLMYESCMQSLRVFLMRMGWIADARQSSFEPVPGIQSQLRCRGQVIPGVKKALYEISIKELGYNPEPYAIADALMFADGKRIVQVIDMSIRLSGTTRESIESIWQKSGRKTAVQKSDILPALYTGQQILEYAKGRPSLCFGEKFAAFDKDRFLARLPNPPYLFVDRITAVDAEFLKIQTGGHVQGQFDVLPDAWYFKANRQTSMPFSVLLEFPLQVCGWYSCFMGSAFSSDHPLHYRNLDGSATLYEDINTDSGALTADVYATRTASSAGMLIQSFDILVTRNGRKVYEGNTTFGFFSEESLAHQVGLRGVKVYQPSEEEQKSAIRLPFDDLAPENPQDPARVELNGLQMPGKAYKMLDRIDMYIENAGPFGKGFIRGTKKVNPSDWFFKAHFYQDPVIPGSLGLESFLQLLKAVAIKKWKPELKDRKCRFLPFALNQPHQWSYRGQVIPKDNLVTVDAYIKEIDDQELLIKADGFLSVDGRIIYSMKDFAVKVDI